MSERIFYDFGILACPTIANCIEMHCYDTPTSTICANCEGVVRDTPFYRAYVRSDNKKQCLRMYVTMSKCNTN